jgi:hypothetical protein
MILDIDVRMLDGEMCLCKYGPKVPKSIHTENGFVNFSIKDYSWQKVISIEQLSAVLNKVSTEKVKDIDNRVQHLEKLMVA